MKRPTLIVALVALTTVIAFPSLSRAEWRSGGGYFEISLDKSGKPGSNLVAWFWAPTYEPGRPQLRLFARCTRTDANGNPMGNHKVSFKQVEIASLTGSLVASFKNQSGKIKNGLMEWVVWDAQFMEPLVATGAAAGVAQIQVKGKVKAGDVLTCQIDVTETVGVEGFASTAALRTNTRQAGTGELLRRDEKP
jgi:hypothetical protein